MAEDRGRHPSEMAVVYDGIQHWCRCRVLVRGADLAIVARRGLATVAFEVCLHEDTGPTCKGFWAHSGLLEWMRDAECAFLLSVYGEVGFRGVLGELVMVMDHIAGS